MHQYSRDQNILKVYNFSKIRIIFHYKFRPIKLRTKHGLGSDPDKLAFIRVYMLYIYNGSIGLCFGRVLDQMG